MITIFPLGVSAAAEQAASEAAKVAKMQKEYSEGWEAGYAEVLLDKSRSRAFEAGHLQGQLAFDQVAGFCMSCGAGQADGSPGICVCG